METCLLSLHMIKNTMSLSGSDETLLTVLTTTFHVHLAVSKPVLTSPEHIQALVQVNLQRHHRDRQRDREGDI